MSTIPDGPASTPTETPIGAPATASGTSGGAAVVSGGGGMIPRLRSLTSGTGRIDLFDLWPIIVTAAIIAYSSLRFANYFSVYNFEVIITQIAPLGIVAMGQTFLLISAGLDLSVSYNMAFATIITGLLYSGTPVFGFHLQYHPLWLCILFGLAGATLVGLINGILVAQNRAHPFIITLGMSIFLLGLDQEMTGGAPVNNMGGLYTAFGGYLPNRFPFFGLPSLTIPLVAMVIIAYAFLRWSPIGRQAYAIGGNEEAAYLSGIRVKRTKIILYTLMGLIVGFAAMCLAGEINEASFNLANNYELQSIAACVIGGTALFGGRGGALRFLQGVILLGVVYNSVAYSGLSSNYQQMALGVIIIAAVMVTRAQR